MTLGRIWGWRGNRRWALKIYQDSGSVETPQFDRIINNDSHAATALPPSVPLSSPSDTKYKGYKKGVVYEEDKQTHGSFSYELRATRCVGDSADRKTLRGRFGGSRVIKPYRFWLRSHPGNSLLGVMDTLPRNEMCVGDSIAERERETAR